MMAAGGGSGAILLIVVHTIKDRQSGQHNKISSLLDINEVVTIKDRQIGHKQQHNKISSLLDLNESFPIKYSIEFDCSESNLEEVVEKVASFTSKVYSTFTTLSKERKEQLKQAGVWFSKLDETSTTEECEQFEIALKKRIITVLNQKEKGDSIELSTDYFPEKILCEVAESAFKKGRQLGFLFPCKTCTRIYLIKERTKLCLDMNFKGPSF